MNDVIRRFQEKFADTEVTQHNQRRFYITVNRDQIVSASQFMFREIGSRLSICTGTDTRDGFEILYHFSHDSTGIIYSLRILIPKDEAKVASITSVVPAANWIEREIAEMLGVTFEGHPNPKPLLTSDVDWDATKYPHRRDYDRQADVKPKPWETK